MIKFEEIIVINSSDEIEVSQLRFRLNMKLLEDKVKAEIMAEEDKRIFEILNNLGR